MQPPGAGARRVPLQTRATLTAQETQRTIEIEVALRMRALPELQARIRRGEKITPQELAAKYQPAVADYTVVTNWLISEGLTITRTDPGHLAVFARGTVRQLQRSFQVNFARVSFQNAEFTSAITAPSLPVGIARAVLGVNGLQPHLRLQKHLRPAAMTPGSTATTFAPAYWPRDILRAYGGNALAQNGAGQTIGIVIDTFPATSDLTSFWAMAGIPQSLSNMQFTQVVSGPLPAPSGEETLDTEWTSGIAPGAKVRVYATTDLSTTNLDQAYAQIYSEVSNGSQPTLHQLSLSYGLGELILSAGQVQTDEQYFAELAAAGVTVFVSTGDGGSNPDGAGTPVDVSSPSSSPNVTAVGGTSIALNSATGAVTGETVWSGTGGGASAFFARPPWQTGTGVAAGATRLVPDVSAPADPGNGALVFLNGFAQQYGGTSWGAPTWAGFCARLNQARAVTGQAPIGLLGPKIYPLLGTAAFRDITSGDNGAYGAGVGFDECTGLGVPNLALLFNALTNPPLLTFSTPSQTVLPGATATFSVVGSGATAVSFQWQRLPAGGATWSNLADNATFAGSATATLVITGITAASLGDQFRCVLTNSFGTATSAPAALLVAAPDQLVTVAGFSGVAGSTNGPAASASFNFPNGIAVDSAGNIYAADMSNNRIRKITPAGVVSTYAGSGISGSTNGPAGSARFNLPAGVATDASGNVYVADYGNSTIRKITPAGNVSTLAGHAGNAGSTNSAIGVFATFTNPADLAVDSSGNVFVADSGNNLIRKITSAGAVTTFAGSGVAGFADGTGTAAGFNAPGGIAVDVAGNVYVADQLNSLIRKITPSGVVTTLAGAAGTIGSNDALIGSDARFSSPGDVVPDAAGNVYVVDCNNFTLREILVSGSVITVSGLAGTAGNSDGAGTAGRFVGAGSIAMDPSGNLVIADTTGNAIRRATPLTSPQVQISPPGLTLNVGANAVFSATVTGTPSPACQWQRFPAGGSAWANLTDNTIFGGSTTPTLTVQSVTLALSGDQFRCVVSSVAGSATSAITALTVQQPPHITSTASAMFTVGQPGSFTVTATGVPTPALTVTGLPVWASFDPNTGIIAGTPPNPTGTPFALTITAGNGASPDAVQSFTLNVQATLTSWLLANPGAGAGNANNPFNTLPNLLNYAFGSNPLLGAGANLPVISFTFDPADGQSHLTLTAVLDATASGITVSAEASDDLQTWVTGAGKVINVSDSTVGTVRTVIFRDATPLSAATVRFIRLHVTQPRSGCHRPRRVHAGARGAGAVWGVRSISAMPASSTNPE